MLQLSQCSQWMSSISPSSVQWLDIEYYESDTRRLTAMGHQTGLVKLAVVDAVKTGLFKQKNMNPCQTIDPYLHVHYSNFTCTNKKIKQFFWRLKSSIFQYFSEILQTYVTAHDSPITSVRLFYPVTNFSPPPFVKSGKILVMCAMHATLFNIWRTVLP